MNLVPLSLPLGFHEWLPAFQAVTLGLLTFVQEDVPTVSAALLSSTGRISWMAAFFGVFLGIWIGDALLYLLARGIGRPLLQKRWAQKFLNPNAIAWSERWFNEKGTWLLLSSRFVPGTRLPTYLAAGFLQSSFPRFLAVTGTGVAIWTISIFTLAYAIGPNLLIWLKQWNTGAWAMAVIVGLTLLAIKSSIRACAGCRSRRKETLLKIRNPKSEIASQKSLLTSAPTSLKKVRHRILASLGRCTRWEFWPAWLFYSPVALNYLWLAIRHRGLTVPTAANPGMFSGGFVGESKIDTLRDLHSAGPEFTAEAHLIKGETTAERLASLNRLRELHEIDYPFILKPDIGQRGVGVKLIRTLEQANAYLQQPAAPVIIQRYAEGPCEVGVFYYRLPYECRGHIFAITEKIFPTVVGDGQRTLEELIWQDRRARFLADRYLQRLEDRRQDVLRPGEIVKLVEAGNHAQGCIFRDGNHLWSQQLEARIDDISQRLNGFFIGRYDLRYSSADDLRAGRNFKIIELNGAASEATSIYDARNSLFAAYRTLFRQWELVFAIGAANRGRGVAPTKPEALWRAWRRTTALIATYPLAD